MKKIIIIMLLIFPLSLIAKGDGVWSNTKTHKTVGYQSRHSIRHSKEKKYQKTAKSIRKLQKKWKSLEYKN